MFARLTRLPLRRSLHTSASPAAAPWARSRVAYGVGAAVTASYLAWRLHADRIALDSASEASTDSEPSKAPSDAEATIEAKAEEASAAGGAYDPNTGEINWDCPCLGGMAQGPCGEQFKAAFSCFVFSEAEPKGINCVDAFRTMQDCFREHPDVYADEIGDDEEEAPSEPERKFHNIHSEDVDF
ncbi:hypothetical protein EV121DRAFT_261463 [Schizophyllum commune]